MCKDEKQTNKQKQMCVCFVVDALLTILKFSLNFVRSFKRREKKKE